jgi:hypothetical protein
MNTRYPLSLAAVAAIAALTACNQPADTTVTKSAAATTSPQGKVETSQESKQVGNTLEAKTETKSTTDQGTVKANVQTFIGTVTVYEPGKTIEVLTGENSRHGVDLAAKETIVTVVGPVAVGAHVRLVETKGDRGTKVDVTVEGGKS